jgi:hypothetical protein
MESHRLPAPARLRVAQYAIGLKFEGLKPVTNTHETFLRWDPWPWYRDVPSISIAAVIDDWEGFRLILTGDNCPATRVCVGHGHLVMHRLYDEVGLIGTNIQGLLPGHCFYKAESSRLLTECSMMHSGTRDTGSLHYAIYTSGRCIDLICTSEPSFVLLRDFASGRYASESPEPSS